MRGRPRAIESEFSRGRPVQPMNVMQGDMPETPCRTREIPHMNNDMYGDSDSVRSPPSQPMAKTLDHFVDLPLSIGKFVVRFIHA